MDSMLTATPAPASSSAGWLILALVIGVLLGAAVGWLAHALWEGRAANAPRHGAGPRGGSLGDAASRDADSRDAERALPVAAADVDRSLNLALGPIREAVVALGDRVMEMERNREVSQSALASHIQSMTRASSRLNERTDELVTALRSPQIRGRWGEMQLERVVELGGMHRHVDFDPQVTARVGDQVLRPDMIIHLAGDRSIIVDAKVPFSAYLDALDTRDPEEHAAFLRRHAHLLKNHINQLSSRGYTNAFQPTPEFVVLFVPSDPFLDAALSIDPELLDYAFQRDVVLATPTSMFALLRTVALGWRHDGVADKAREILQLGRELHSRLGTMADHYNKVGQQLGKTVEAFNSTVGSFDARVAVTSRRLYDLDIGAKSAGADIDQVNVRPRVASPPPHEGHSL